MVPHMPVPLVPGERGRAVFDAELPPLSREELDAILGLLGGVGDPTCDECRKKCSRAVGPGPA